MISKGKMVATAAIIAVVVGLVFAGTYPAVTAAKISCELLASHSSPYDVKDQGITINVVKLSYLEYATSRKRSVSERQTTATDIVTVKITFNLETPTGTNLTIGEFDLAGEGFKEFNLVIGPNEGLTESGTFTLTIEIYLKAQPIGIPVVELTKTIERTFTVP